MPEEKGIVFYCKLVRDHMIEVCEEDGNRGGFRTLSDEEYGIELDRKLVEEVAEYLESRDIRELADLKEVIETIAEHRHGGFTNLMVAQERKFRARGGFTKKLYMIWCEYRKPRDNYLTKDEVFKSSNHPWCKAFSDWSKSQR